MTKYHARRTVVDGHTFDSAAEARRYGELRLMERAGEIEGLDLQPAFPLTVEGVKVATYYGDFWYIVTATGRGVLEDVKGVRTPVYRLKAKLVKAIYNITIIEVKA